MSWLFLHWFSVLSASWPCLYCCIFCNLYCKLYILMLWLCWASLTIFYCWPFPCSYSSTFSGWQGNPWNSSSLLSVSQVILENLWSAACFGLWFSFLKWNPSGSSKMLHMVEACFYALLFSSFYLDFSLVALHTPSYLLLCNPLSYKCHFPSKTSTSLCLHPLQSLSLKLCHLCEVVLNMHLLFFAFLSFDLVAAIL